MDQDDVWGADLIPPFDLVRDLHLRPLPGGEDAKTMAEEEDDEDYRRKRRILSSLPKHENNKKGHDNENNYMSMLNRYVAHLKSSAKTNATAAGIENLQAMKKIVSANANNNNKRSLCRRPSHERIGVASH